MNTIKALIVGALMGWIGYLANSGLGWLMFLSGTLGALYVLNKE